MIFGQTAGALQFREPFDACFRPSQHRNRDGFVQFDNGRGRNALQLAIERDDARPIGVLWLRRRRVNRGNLRFDAITRSACAIRYCPAKRFVALSPSTDA